MSEARRELAFRRASASLVFLFWDLCYIHLLKKEGILTYVKNGVLLLNIFSRKIQCINDLVQSGRENPQRTEAVIPQVAD